MDLSQAFDAAVPAVPAGADACWSTDGVVSLLIDRREWKAFHDGAPALLDVAEGARVERKRMASDRETTQLAYALHRLLLGRCLGCSPRDVPIFRDALGCPRLPPGSLHTSLSHSDPFIALAVSGAGPVGIDIEPVERAGTMHEIASRVAHPLELAALAPLTGAGRAAALLSLWVRKEAVLKAAGVGLGEEMSAFLAPDGEALDKPVGLGAPFEVRTLAAGSTTVCAVSAPAGFALDWSWGRLPD